MEFAIEKGINLTKKRTSKFDKIPVNQMIIGDSIFIPSDYLCNNSLQNYIRVYNNQNDTYIRTKKEKTGTRIFRIK